MPDDWKIVDIRVQDAGPRYVIDGDDVTACAERIVVNGAALSFTDRLELEYTNLNIRNRTAYFVQPRRDRSPDLEASLDGLQTVVQYCEDRGLGHLATRAARLYQDLGSNAPVKDWEDADA